MCPVISKKCDAKNGRIRSYIDTALRAKRSTIASDSPSLPLLSASASKNSNDVSAASIAAFSVESSLPILCTIREAAISRR